MDVVLKVLQGAKEGTKIAIKKENFLIGRSPKCHLCVGSSSVSRRHCAILRKDATVRLKDLNSSNGTLLNGQLITEEVDLSTGDEIVVGPLHFLVTITHGINNLKRPQVKTIADAVERTAEAIDAEIQDDDITHWITDTEPTPKTQADKETQSMRLDDTNAAKTQQTEKAPAEQESTSNQDAVEETDSTTTAEPEKKESEPGKLPPIPPPQTTKDSREAAVEALRSWNRRR